jgi:hypothetical protein
LFLSSSSSHSRCSVSRACTQYLPQPDTIVQSAWCSNTKIRSRHFPLR